MTEVKKEEKTVDQRLSDVEVAIRELTRPIAEQHELDRQNLAKYLTRIDSSLKNIK